MPKLSETNKIYSYVLMVVAVGTCTAVAVSVFWSTRRASHRRRFKTEGGARDPLLRSSGLRDDYAARFQASTTDGVVLDGKYLVLRQLGKGSFSFVYLVKRLSDGQLFALKYVMCSDDTSRTQALKECEMVHRLQAHPNIIKLVDMFMSYKFDKLPTAEDTDEDQNVQESQHSPVLHHERYLCLVMEYHERGDVGHWAREQWIFKASRPGLVISENIVVSIAHQVLSVLHFMHSQVPPIVHRDLKPENLLLSSGLGTDAREWGGFCSIVVTDFGLSRPLDTTFCETGAGSLPYVAPECWKRQYSTKADIWSLGCILYGLCTGRVAAADVRVMFSECTQPEFEASIRRDLEDQTKPQFDPEMKPEWESHPFRSPDVSGYSPQLASFVLSMLEPDLALRPSAEQLLKSIRTHQPEEGASRTGRDGNGAEAALFCYIDPEFTKAKDTIKME